MDIFQVVCKQTNELFVNTGIDINEWVGLAGTLLGVILGALLTFFSKLGKLKVYVYDWKDCFFYNKMEKYSDYDIVGSSQKPRNNYDDTFWSRIMTNCIESTKNYEYSCSVDIYNSSENSKIMRNIKIVFYGKKGLRKRKLKEDIPKDYSTKRGEVPYYFYSEIEPINIAPKTLKKIMLIHELTEFDFIWNTEEVFLEYTDENNRRKKIRIKKEDYGKYFQNHTLEV